MKLKFTFLVLFFLVFSKATFAQDINYDRIIPPTYLPTLSFSEKLVYLAWKNHPSNDILAHRKNIAEKNKTKANWAWLDILSASGNLNEFTLNKESTRSEFYPRYNFGARINMNIFVDVPADIRIAKEEVKIANATLDNQKLSLRAEVLRAYENYLLAQEILNIQTESTEEAYSTFLLNEQKFKNGEISLELYNQALSNYNSERRGKLNAESNYNISKINLEEFIGISLEEVK